MDSLNLDQKPSYLSSASWAKPLRRLVFYNYFFTIIFLRAYYFCFFYSYNLFSSYYFFRFSISSSNSFFIWWSVPPYREAVKGATLTELLIFFRAIDSSNATNDFLTRNSSLNYYYSSRVTPNFFASSVESTLLWAL